MNTANKAVIVKALNQQFKKTTISAACQLDSNPTDEECNECCLLIVEAHKERVEATKAITGEGCDNAINILNATSMGRTA